MARDGARFCTANSLYVETCTLQVLAAQQVTTFHELSTAKIMSLFASSAFDLRLSTCDFGLPLYLWAEANKTTTF